MKGVIWTGPQSKKEQAVKQEPVVVREDKNKVFSVTDYKYVSKRYGIVILLGVFAILGLISGSIFSKDIDVQTLISLDFIFLSDYQLRLEQSLVVVFMTSLCSYFLFYLAQVLMAFSAWGFIFMPITTFLKGFGVGLCAGFLASTYSFTGVGFYVLIMLPATVISLISMLIQGKESFNLSKKIFKSLIKDKDKNKSLSNLNLSSFFIMSANMVILVAVSASVDVLTTLCFSSLFSF